MCSRTLAAMETDMTRVNIYRSAGVWCYALWIDGEYDSSYEIDDVESESEAIAWAAAQWPDATIRVVEATGAAL